MSINYKSNLIRSAATSPAQNRNKDGVSERSQSREPAERSQLNELTRLTNALNRGFARSRGASLTPVTASERMRSRTPEIDDIPDEGERMHKEETKT